MIGEGNDKVVRSKINHPSRPHTHTTPFDDDDYEKDEAKHENEEDRVLVDHHVHDCHAFK